MNFSFQRLPFQVLPPLLGRELGREIPTVVASLPDIYPRSRVVSLVHLLDEEARSICVWFLLPDASFLYKHYFFGKNVDNTILSSSIADSLVQFSHWLCVPSSLFLVFLASSPPYLFLSSPTLSLSSPPNFIKILMKLSLLHNINLPVVV